MFLGQPLRVFHFFMLLFLQLFSGVFIFDCIWSLHFTVCWVLHFWVVVVVVPRVLRIWESIFYSQVFFYLFYTPSQHLAQPPFIKSSLELAAQPWRLQSLPLRFETQTQCIYFFESHSVQQKVLVGKFYSYAWVSSWNTNQPLTGFEPVF